MNFLYSSVLICAIRGNEIAAEGGVSVFNIPFVNDKSRFLSI